MVFILVHCSHPSPPIILSNILNTLEKKKNCVSYFKIGVRVTKSRVVQLTLIGLIYEESQS